MKRIGLNRKGLQFAPRDFAFFILRKHRAASSTKITKGLIVLWLTMDWRQ